MDVLIIEPHRLLLADAADGMDEIRALAGGCPEIAEIYGDHSARIYRNDQTDPALEPNVLATLFERTHASLADDRLLSGIVLIVGRGEDGSDQDAPEWVLDALKQLIPEAQAIGEAAGAAPC